MHRQRGGALYPSSSAVNPPGFSKRDQIVDGRLFAISDLPETSSVERSEWLVINPTASLYSGTTLNDSIEFINSAGSEGVYDLSRSFIITNCAVTRDGTACVRFGVDEVSLKTNFGDTMWRNIQTSLGGKDVTDEHVDRYPYNAWFRQLLTKTADNGKGSADLMVNHIQQAADKTINGEWRNTTFNGGDYLSETEMFVLAAPQDTEHNCAIQSVARVPLGENDLLINNCRNSQAFALHRQIASEDGTALKNFDVITRPKEGIWMQDKYIPSTLDFRVVLYHAADALRLKSQAGLLPTLKVNRCQLFLRRLTLSEMARASLAVAFKEVGTFTYPVWHSKIDTRSLGAVSVGPIDQTNILSGSYPDLVIVAFIPTVALTGDLHTSPFCTSAYRDNSAGTTTPGPAIPATYKAPEISGIYINVAGVQYPKQRQYENLSKGAAMRPYIDYVNECGTGVNPTDSPCLGYEQYLKNYPFYCFNTRKDGEPTSLGVATDDSMHRSIEVHAQCSTASTGAVSMLTMVFSNAYVKISADKNVSTEGW